MANIFQLVPHDVLQNELLPLLNVSDRVTFNRVNHPFERIYKKLSTDYLMRIHINVMKQQYNIITARLNNRYGPNDVDLTLKQAADVVQLYFKLFSLLESPLFVPVFQHDTRGRGAICLTIANMTEDVDFVEHTSEEMKDNLRVRCAEVQAYITGIPFVREIAKSVPRRSTWHCLSPAERAAALRAGRSEQD